MDKEEKLNNVTVKYCERESLINKSVLNIHRPIMQKNIIRRIFFIWLILKCEHPTKAHFFRVGYRYSV